MKNQHQRAPPVPAAKIRNLQEHCKNGNTEPRTRSEKQQKGLKKQRVLKRKRTTAKMLATKKLKKEAVELAGAAEHIQQQPSPSSAQPDSVSAPSAGPRQPLQRQRGRFASASSKPSDPDPTYVPHSRSVTTRRLHRRRRQSVSQQTDTGLLSVLRTDVAIMPQWRPQRPMSHAELTALQIEGGFSGQQMLVMMQHHRRALGTQLIYQPNYRETTVNLNLLFTHQFQADTVHQLPVVVPVNMTALLSQLSDLHHRRIATVLIGCDAGQAFLKICVSIRWTDDAADHPQPLSTGGAGKIISDQARRRCILVAIMPSMKESFQVLQELFQLIAFPKDVPFMFVGDLKVLNIALGLSTAAATHPCPYCEVVMLASVPLAEQLRAGKPRTYATISRHAHELKDADDDAKNHASVLRTPLPLLSHHPNRNIDLVAAHPGLHYLLSGNWFIHRLEQLLPDVDEWWRKYNFVRPQYHSGAFEGNQMRRLLRPDSILALRDIIDDLQPLSATRTLTTDRRRSQRHVVTAALPPHRALLNCLVSFAYVLHLLRSSASPRMGDMHRHVSRRCAGASLPPHTCKVPYNRNACACVVSS